VTDKSGHNAGIRKLQKTSSFFLLFVTVSFYITKTFTEFVMKMVIESLKILLYLACCDNCDQKYVLNSQTNPPPNMALTGTPQMDTPSTRSITA
jgi:hypothetical protein